MAALSAVDHCEYSILFLVQSWESYGSSGIHSKTKPRSQALPPPELKNFKLSMSRILNTLDPSESSPDIIDTSDYSLVTLDTNKLDTNTQDTRY